jgi:cytochrome d ubiquinol oxidase subunit I
MTAEFGRQPWIIYNLMRTAEAYSDNVSTGNAAFTLLGFMGMYTFISILFLFMMFRVIGEGPSLESRAQTRIPSTTQEVL